MSRIRVAAMTDYFLCGDPLVLIAGILIAENSWPLG